MKSYQRIFLFLLLMLVATALLSPWLTMLWNSITEARPQWQQYRYPLSDIFGRMFMVMGVVLFFPCRSLLRIQSAGQLGLKVIRPGYRDILCGFVIALLSLAAIVLLMSLSGIFTPFFRLSFSDGAERSIKALLSALAVGFFEEIFFRGVIFKGMLEDTKPPTAFAVSSLFYSAVHFIKPAEEISSSSLNAWAGIRYLIGSFHPFLDPFPLLPGLFGLFLIGMVLAYAFLRTGSLYLSMGLHMGWVFGLKSIRIYGDFRRENLGWLFGSSEPKLVSGIAAWIGIIAVGVIVHYLTRKRSAHLIIQP